MKSRAKWTLTGLLAIALVVVVASRAKAPRLPPREPAVVGAHADEAALGRSNVRELLAFVAAHPGSPRAAEARALVDQLRSDEEPWLRAAADATSDGLDRFLADFPGHAREAEARALRARMEPRSVFDLVAEGAVELAASGAGIERMKVDLVRRAPHEISVVFPVGTYFVAAGDSQNMVATRATVVRLATTEPTEAEIRVACANRELPVPGSEDRFHLEVAPRQRELQALAPILELADLDTATAQAAVWIVTDDADYAALGSLVISHGFGGGPRAIDEASAVTAEKLCSEAGVDVERLAIAKDEFLLVHGLSVAAHGVAEWCRAALERRGYGGTPGAIVVGIMERAEDGPLVDATSAVVRSLASEVEAAGLRALAGADSARTRRRVATALGKIADPSDLETLLDLARASEVEVRVAALEALRAHDTTRARPAFVRALAAESDEVVVAGLDALEGAGSPELVPPLVDLARSSRAGWLRARAVRLLTTLSPQAGELALEIRAVCELALGAEDETLSTAALEGLARTKDPALVAPIVAALRRGRSDWFRAEAVRALDQLGGPASRAERLRLLADPDEFVVGTAIDSLIDEEGADVADACIARLRQSESPILSDDLARALGAMRGPEVSARLRKAATDESPAVRAAVAGVLSESADAGDLEILLGLAADPAERVRAAAVTALPRSADERARAAFVRALADESDAVALAARMAASWMPRLELVAALEGALQRDVRPALRSELVLALAETATPAAAEALWRRFGSAHDAHFRRELVQALDPIAPASLLPALESAAAGEADPGVREALEAAARSVRGRLPAPAPGR